MVNIAQMRIARPPDQLYALGLGSCIGVVLYDPQRKIAGMPVYQYFKRAKMQRAMELLKTTAQSIREIAFQCGYSSQGQFSAAFRSEFGLTPLQARKVVRSDNVGLGQKNAISGDTL